MYLVQCVLVKHQITQVTHPSYSPDLVHCDFWIFPKPKLPLKGKRFLTISEIQENTMRQLMAIRRIVWGHKVPTLKGTEVSLSYVQCFLYLVSSSISVYFSLHMAGYFLDRLYIFYLFKPRVGVANYGPESGCLFFLLFVAKALLTEKWLKDHLF